MQQPTVIDHCGTPLYVGVDVGKRSWQVSIHSVDQELATFQAPPQPEVLVRHLRKQYPGAEAHVAYEAGFCGFWIERALRAEHIACMVVHAADIPTTNKERWTKTDRIDARKIAVSLRAGQLRPIYVPTEEQEQARALVRMRMRVATDRRVARYRIVSLLDQFGVTPPMPTPLRWNRETMQWLQSLHLSTSGGRSAFGLLMKRLAFFDEHVRNADEQIRIEMQRDEWRPTVTLLQSIVGIGALSAAIWAVELSPIGRFPSLDQLASYVGVVPRYRQSADTATVLGVTHRVGDLRRVLIENAWVAIKHDPELRRLYNHLTTARRQHSNKAIVHVGRALLARMRAVLIHNKPYEVRQPKTRLVVKRQSTIAPS